MIFEKGAADCVYCLEALLTGPLSVVMQNVSRQWESLHCGKMFKEPSIRIVQGVFQCVENSSFEEGGNLVSVI